MSSTVTSHTTPKAPLKSSSVGAPFEKIGIDIIGPLPLTYSENKYILSITDYFTKWVELYPMEDQKAVTVSSILLNNFISRFSLVRQILTDQDRQFESLVFKSCVNDLILIR